jgi:hypothetical protein
MIHLPLRACPGEPLRLPQNSVRALLAAFGLREARSGICCFIAPVLLSFCFNSPFFIFLVCAGARRATLLHLVRHRVRPRCPRNTR